MKGNANNNNNNDTSEYIFCKMRGWTEPKTSDITLQRQQK